MCPYLFVIYHLDFVLIIKIDEKEMWWVAFMLSVIIIAMS